MEIVEKPSVKGFISYARTDNAAFDGIVDRLKAEIEGKFLATTGRKLELFLDRESLGWGDDWRDTINESVRSALVFIPIVSQAFFQSDACREELLAFTSAADELGVTDLILPIVIAGADRITSDHEQDEVRLIERLNYKDVERGYLDGYDSAAWRKRLHEMVNSLDKRLITAEARLEELEKSAIPSDDESTGDGGLEVDEEYDIFTLTDDLTVVTDATNAAVASLTALGETVSNSGLDLNSGTTAQKRARFALLAGKVAQPAIEVGNRGRDLERRVVALDPQLRGVLHAMGEADVPAMTTQRAKLIEKLSTLSELRPVVTELEKAVGVLQMVGVVSVSMKKALAPALGGMRSIRGALEVVDSWRSI